MSVRCDVVLVGVFFLLLFTSSASLSQIQTQLFEQLDLPYLGELTLFLSYGSFMLWCLLAPYVGKRVNYKRLLVAASVCEMLSYSSCVWLHYSNYHPLAVVALEVSTVVDGFASALMWVAQAAYIHHACEANGLHMRTGYYFGVFSGVYGLCNITSGLITTFALGFFDPAVYFWLLEGLSVLTLLFCIFAVPDVQKKYPVEIADGPVLLMEGQLSQTAEKERLFPAIARVFRFYSRMVPLLPSIGLVGISIAFYSSSLHKVLEMAMPAMAENNYVSLRTGIMFLVLGLGEIAGGYMSGVLSDSMLVRRVGALALGSYLLSVTLTLLAVTYHQTVVPVMLAAFFWGFQEAYIQNWITVVCSKVYSGALEAFIINKQFHCVTLCLYELLLLLWYPSMEVIVPMLLVCAVPCLLALSYIREESPKKTLGDPAIATSETSTA